VFDLVVLGAMFVGTVRVGLRSWWFILCWIVYLEIGYWCGGSLVKLLLGLRVVIPNRRALYFRETIGKLASIATFGVGFALVLTKDRLALHDYMARTSVCDGRLPFKGSQIVAFLALAAIGAPVAYRSLTAVRQEQSVEDESRNGDFIQRITGQMAAVGTVYTYGRTGRSAFTTWP